MELEYGIPDIQATIIESQLKLAHLTVNTGKRTMFSCCFRRPGDSGLRQERCECLTHTCRYWIHAKPQVQHLRPFSKKKRMEMQGDSGKGDNESVPALNVPYNVWSPEAGLLEMLVLNLVPAHQKGDTFFTRNFIHNYRLCGTMEQVLDILFKKYRSLRPNCEEDERLKNTLCSIFTMWMDFYPDDFYERKNRDTLNKLMYYVMLNMPSSDLFFRLHILLDQLEEPVANQKKREESLCRLLRACLGHHRAASRELEIKNPPLMSAMVTDGDLEPSLDSRKHVNVKWFVPIAEKPKQVLSPVASPLVLHPTCDTGELEDSPEEDRPWTFPGSLDWLLMSQVSTPAGVEDKLAPMELMENIPTLSLGEPVSEIQKLDSVEKSEYLDKSFLLQEKKLESVSSSTQEENLVFKEMVNPFEDPDLTFLPEGNLEADLLLEFPFLFPGKIFIFLFVMIAVKWLFYLFF